MSKLESVRFNQIFTLLEVLSNSNLFLLNEIERKYESYAANFQSTAIFLNKLGMIELSKTHIKLIDSDGITQSQVSNNEQYKTALKETLGKRLLSKDSLYFDALNELFADVIEETDGYLLRSPTPPHLVDIRNLLIELEVIDFNYETQTYFISNSALVNNRRFIKVSKRQMDENLRNQEELGEVAELAVIKFEKEKLFGSDLLRKIKHVSHDNVKAGYDIDSFKDTLTKKPIAIEVKAVSIRDYAFKWSRNEMDCAKELKDKYHLYLVPVIANKIFDLEKLKIIENPFKNIILNKNGWDKETEVLSIKKKNEKKES